MNGDAESSESRRAAGFVGWAAWGSLMVGIAAFLNALGALAESKHDFGSAAVSLVAAALAFGLLSNALLRK